MPKSTSDDEKVPSPGLFRKTKVKYMTLSLRKIYPLSEFQSGVKVFLEKLRGTKEPIVLTVDGKASVVVQDAESYQQLLDRLELLETITGVHKSLEEFKQGKGIPLDEAFQQLQAKYDIPG